MENGKVNVKQDFLEIFNHPELDSFQRWWRLFANEIHVYCVTVSLVEYVFHFGNILHFGKDSCQASSWGLIFCFLMNSINPNELFFIFQTVIGVDHNGYYWTTMETTVLFWASKFWSCFNFVPKHDFHWCDPPTRLCWCADAQILEI